jgi:energy-coupling factor transporter ATP-binding protein EcfA2
VCRLHGGVLPRQHECSTLPSFGRHQGLGVVLIWRRRPRVPDAQSGPQGSASHLRLDSEQSTGGEAALPRRAGRLYADDPLEEPHQDLLDRNRLAQQLARVIRAVAEQSESAVVALVGPWGSGKTSLVKAIEARLKADAGWYLAWHNPWAYSSYEEAIPGFFAELKAALPEDALTQGARASIGEWGARIAPLGAAAGLVGVDASGPLAQVAALIAGDRSPEALRKEAAGQLRKLKRPVLVVLDDLDRLEPRELLLTFKLVRLLGRLPNVYYLLAYDEQTLTDVLERTELVGSGAGRARQYLEKMVQVRLDIPPLLQEQQLALMNAGIDDLCARHGIELTTDGQTRLQQAWNECLVSYLDQPRAFKRLFTQVDAHWPEVAGEVDFVDFMLMTFLLTFERGMYDAVLEHRSELLGGLVSVLQSQKEAHNARWTRWVGLANDRRARYPERVLVLLTELFLPLRSARENMTYGSDFMEDVRRRRGVGCEEFFDRYVQIGVPASDLSEGLITEAIDDLRRGTSGPGVQQLRDRLGTDASQVIRKLIRRDDATALPAAPTLDMLADHYLVAMNQKSGSMGLSPDFGFLLLGTQILDRLDISDALHQAQRLVVEPPGLALVSDIVQRATYGDQQQPWVAELTPTVVAALEQHLRHATAIPLPESPRVVRYMFAFKNLTSPEEARELIWALLDESSVWTLEDLLALLVPVGSASNGRRSWASLGDLSVGEVDALLGVDRVLEALPELPGAETAETEPDLDGASSEVAMAHRRARAIAALTRVREQRAQAPVDPLPDAESGPQPAEEWSDG